MNIHRNTLSYRLDQIERITGLNPRQFSELVVLDCGLRLAVLDCCADAQ